MKCGRCGEDGILTTRVDSPFSYHLWTSQKMDTNLSFQWYCPICGFRGNKHRDGINPLGNYISEDEAFQMATDSFTAGKEDRFIDHWSDCPAKREYMRKQALKNEENSRL